MKNIYISALIFAISLVVAIALFAAYFKVERPKEGVVSILTRKIKIHKGFYLQFCRHL